MRFRVLNLLGRPSGPYGWIYLLIAKVAIFAVALLVPVVVTAWKIYGIYSDDSPFAEPPPDGPEPISAVSPSVAGWKAVTSAQYGLSYDVPTSWRVTDPETLIGLEDAQAKPKVAMSTAAVFREGYCKYEQRAAAGFNHPLGGTPGFGESSHRDRQECRPEMGDWRLPAHGPGKFVI